MGCHFLRFLQSGLVLQRFSTIINENTMRHYQAYAQLLYFMTSFVRSLRTLEHKKDLNDKFLSGNTNTSLSSIINTNKFSFKV